MAFIDLPDPDPDSTDGDDVAKVFAAAEAKWGYVPEIVRAFAHRPPILEAEDDWTNALMHDGVLERSLKELVATTVSAVNECVYCEYSHAYQAATHGATPTALAACRVPDGALRDLTPTEEAAISFTRTAAADMHQVGQADIDALREHYTDEEIVELVLVIASFQLYNTFVTLLGLEPEDGLITRLEATLGRADDRD